MKKKIWIIDMLAFAGFLFALAPAVTGFALHEWLGLAVGLVLLVHAGQHWFWLKKMGCKLDCVKAHIRHKYIVDIMLATGFLVIIVTGVVISSLLNLFLLHYHTWHLVHVAASYATLAMLLWKIGLHWALIKSTFSKAIGRQPAAVKLTCEQLARRNFLKDVGFIVLGVGALALGVRVWNKDTGLLTAQASAELPTPALKTEVIQATATPAGSQVAKLVQPALQQPTATATAAPTVVAQVGKILCTRQCAYPGSCRRYQDNDQNGLCDLGEPIW